MRSQYAFWELLLQLHVDQQLMKHFPFAGGKTIHLEDEK
jgi:hypothetical protein